MFVAADRTIRVHSASKDALAASSSAAPAPLATLYGHAEGISDVSWSPDARLLLSASDDHTARLWDVELGRMVSVLGAPSSTLQQQAGGGAAALAEPGSLLSAHQPVNEGHTNFVMCASFNPQGSLVATGSYDETLRLWDVRTAKCIVAQTAHQEPVTSLAFSGDGTLLATGSYDGLVRVWDVASMQCMLTIVVHDTLANGYAPVTHARFTPNGRFVLSGSLDGKLRLWDYYYTPKRASCVRTFEGHVNAKYCLDSVFLRSGLLVSGSEDGSVVMWDLQNAQVVSTLRGAEHQPTAPILSVAVNPAQDVLLASSNKSILMWHHQTEN